MASSVIPESIQKLPEKLKIARECSLLGNYKDGVFHFREILQCLQMYIDTIKTPKDSREWSKAKRGIEGELHLVLDHMSIMETFKHKPMPKKAVETPPPAYECQQQPANSSSRNHDNYDNRRPNSGEFRPRSQQSQQRPSSSKGNWEIITPESRRKQMEQDGKQNDDEDADPDVWAPPTPDKNRNRGAPPPQQNLPSWADNRSRDNERKSSRPAPRSVSRNNPRKEPVPRQRRPTKDSRPTKQQGNSRQQGNSKYSRDKDGGLSNNAKKEKKKSGDSDEKPKYSEIAREEGYCDLELIESIERDIVETSINVKFEDIAGLDDAKQLLQEAVMLPLFAPQLFKDGRIRACKGVMMFGPPGTGKTLLAKAVAAECGTTFFNVSASTLSSKFRGDSEKMVRILFEMARYYAPTTIFMDEIDAIAGARGGATEHEASRRVKTELLVQINGISSGDGEENRVMLLAATNLPWELDEAMRRRLNKRIYIPLPEDEARLQLFHINLKKVGIAEDIDFDKLVSDTEGYSGDDIAGVCEAAAMMPVRRLITPEVMKEMRGNIDEYINERQKELIVTQDDLTSALSNVSKSVGGEQLDRYKQWMDEFGAK